MAEGGWNLCRGASSADNPGMILNLNRLLAMAAGCLMIVSPACAQGVSAATKAAKPALLVENALIFTMAPGQKTAAERAPVRGYLTVDGKGRLMAVAAGAPPPALHALKVLDVHGHWIIPGFLSAHSHPWQAAFRGLAADSTLTNWLTAVYADNAVKAPPEDFYWFTLSGMIDHLQHGITGVYSFNYGGHDKPGVEEAKTYNGYAFRAEMDSGVRFVHGFDVGSATATGVTPAYTAAQARVPLKGFLTWAKANAAAAPNGTDRYFSTMVSGYTAFSNTRNQAVLDKALMDEFHLGNQSHYLEPPDTSAEEQAKFPWFTETGLLGPTMIFGHFIHTTPAILDATGKAGASMSWNPLSNGRLASGVADIPKYLKYGIRVGMGVDGEASADLADPFENMRSGLYAIRDKYEDASIMSPYDVLKLHTLGSADVLAVADRVGSLEPGKLADFLVVDPTRFGPVTDPYASLVFVADERDLERVYVGGQLLVLRGAFTRQDAAKVQAEVNRRVAAMHPETKSAF
jgi:5-methylthioadenosine/S-adenosylhomocysteine deaminase